MKKSPFLSYSCCLVFIFIHFCSAQENANNTNTNYTNANNTNANYTNANNTNANYTNTNNTTVTENPCQSIFEKSFIVPRILPSVPKEICSVLYKPGSIIVSGQPYFSYQIQDIPDVTWNYKIGKFYTVVALGELQTDEEIPKPIKSWYQWIVVNVRKNNIAMGIQLKPLLFSQTNNLEPNATHRVIYVFGVFEQFGKMNIKVDDKDDLPEIIIQKYFTPLSNFTKSFGGNYLLAGNFFYVVPKYTVGLRDSPPVRYANWQRNLMSIMRPDHYVGL